MHKPRHLPTCGSTMSTQACLLTMGTQYIHRLGYTPVCPIHHHLPEQAKRRMALIGEVIAVHQDPPRSYGNHMPMMGPQRQNPHLGRGVQRSGHQAIRIPAQYLGPKGPNQLLPEGEPMLPGAGPILSMHPLCG